MQEISEENVLEAHLIFEDVFLEKNCLKSSSSAAELEPILIPLNNCDLLPASAPHATAILDFLVCLLPPDSWLATNLATTITKAITSQVIEQILEVST